MTKLRFFKEQKGITLIELLLIMVVVALLASISIPIWVSYMPTMRLNGAARNLQMSMALARMKAVSRNGSASILLQKENNSTSTFYRTDYRLQIWDKDAKAWKDDFDAANPAARPVYPMDLNSVGITITTTYIGNRVIFNPRGACVAAIGGAAADGTVTLTNNEGKSRVIKITGATGFISSD